MAYDEELAERVREALADAADYREQKMFGGVAFMVSDHMVCGIAGGDLMVRLGGEGAAHALAEPHVRPMEFTGRPMRSIIRVSPGGLGSDEELTRWVEAARAFVATLPPKRRRR